MALKNLFDMVKADRYTQDGREALIKAQEAETEDAKAKPEGSVSPDGKRIKQGGKWVPKKEAKQPGAKKESKPGRKMSNGEISERKTKGISVEGIGEGKSFKNENGAKIDITGTGADGSIQFMVTTSEGTKQSHHARSKEEMERILSVNGYAAESKPVDKQKLLDSLSFDLVDTTADIEEEYNAVEHSDNSRLPEFVRQQVEKEYVNKTNGEKWSDAEKDIIAEEVTRRIKERSSENKPAETKTTEKFDVEKWKTGPKVEKNSKLDWSHGVVGESIPVQGKSAEEKRKLINKYNSVGRLSRIGTKKKSYYNNKYGTFEVAGIDNDNVYVQEERSNGMGSRYMVLVTIPLNEVEEINPFHDYGKRNPDTGEESPTRPPLPEDAAPRILTGDTRIRVRKA